MKMTASLLIFLAFFGVTSCDKDIHKMEVVRDCTGDYLRSKSGQDFFVCNDDIITVFENGTKIKVKYDVLTECFGLIETPSCTTQHTFENKIEITDIIE